MSYKKWSISLAAVLLAANLSACSSVDKIVAEIDAKNYDEALDIYDSKTLKEKDIEKLNSEIETRINGYVEAYAGNQISYEELEELLNVVDEMDLDELTEFLVDISIEINELKTSKSNYALAIEYFQNEEYVYAYNYFTEVSEKDGYYKEATEYMNKCVVSFCELVRAEIEDYMQNNNYSDAIYYLSQSKIRAGFSDEAVTAISEMEENVRIENVLYVAKGYVDEGDTASALTTIETAKQDYKFVDTKRIDTYADEISQDYIEMIMTKVNELWESKEYVLALKMLNDAQDVIQSQEFSDAVEAINAEKPTYLYDIKCSASNRFEIIDSGDPLIDSVGNVYKIGNLFTVSAKSSDWDDEGGSAEWNLGYRYRAMTGTISVSDTSENDANAILRIEGDGEVLFAQKLTRTMTPIPIAIDVSAINWLRITVTEAEGGEIAAILSDFVFEEESKEKAEKSSEKVLNTDNSEVSDEDGNIKAEEYDTENVSETINFNEAAENAETA